MENSLIHSRLSNHILTFDPDLPINLNREEIAKALKENQVVIVTGDTGSGKTTQLPKICLDLGYAIEGQIGLTQPRRLAARTVAARIASEIGTPVGSHVGFKIRFEDQLSDDTLIKIMTDGILLSELQQDPDLLQYSTLIIDEAHERSLNIDFILGYLKNLLPRRQDLKVLITSATFDVQSFANHFNNAPIITVEGRRYPINTIYREESSGGEDIFFDIESALSDIVKGDFGEPGDILIFLPTEWHIRQLSKVLRVRKNLQVLPLYARLTHVEQNRVFNTEPGRSIRAVLATNVAETSITVPGIRYVIDPGTARLGRYSYRNQMQRLPIEPISRASADQRRGRCGRMRAGVCLRLYSEEEYLSRPEFTEPEIRRTNLASVVLKMLSLDLGEIEKFSFLDPPERAFIRDGYRLLRELNAVTAEGRLTETGKEMVVLPIDPVLAKMLIAAREKNCLGELLVIVSAMSIKDPRERPLKKTAAADEQHARFRHPKSDFISWLQLWIYFEDRRKMLNQNQLRKLCRKEYLSFSSMCEWRDVHRQLAIAYRRRGVKFSTKFEIDAKYKAIHTSILSGLLSNIARRDKGKEFIAARNRRTNIFPGSVLYRKPPEWIVCGEILETSKVFALSAAAIEPSWLLGVNQSLLKYKYYEPHWHRRSGRVVAFKKISLFGLTISDRQLVHYGSINHDESREIFIQSALIDQASIRLPKFLKYNISLIQSILNLEARKRKKDILVAEEVLFRFYDERIPRNIITLRKLENWLKKNPQEDANLRFSKKFLISSNSEITFNQYPNSITWNEIDFPLSYEFSPGAITDGVTVTVPVGVLNRLPRYLFDWLVPGMLREKCIRLVKGLPKNVRKNLVPVPDFVDEALLKLVPSDISLTYSLAQCLSNSKEISLTEKDFSNVILEDFFYMNIRVVDHRGKFLRQSRDLMSLVAEVKEMKDEETVSSDSVELAQEGLKEWAVEEIPISWRFRQAGIDIISYPALVDCSESVAIRVFDYPLTAQSAHIKGVVRMAQLNNSKDVRVLRKEMLRSSESSLLLAAVSLSRKEVVRSLIDGAILESLSIKDKIPRKKNEFEVSLSNCRRELLLIGFELEAIFIDTLRPIVKAMGKLALLADDIYKDSRRDFMQQIDRLFGKEVLLSASYEWLKQYPRYGQAMEIRIDRLPGNIAKETKSISSLSRLAKPLDIVLEKNPELLILNSPIKDYKWMLEEYRVSLFAQHLGTYKGVSEKRLKLLWESVEEWLSNNRF